MILINNKKTDDAVAAWECCKKWKREFNLFSGCQIHELIPDETYNVIFRDGDTIILKSPRTGNEYKESFKHIFQRYVDGKVDVLIPV